MTRIVLTNKKCVACEGNEKPMSEQEYKTLLKQVNGWRVARKKEIIRNFVFKNFKLAIDFINKVARLAESEGHHPDILLHAYKKLTISLTTHAIGGLSENDFIMAAKINKIQA